MFGIVSKRKYIELEKRLNAALIDIEDKQNVIQTLKKELADSKKKEKKAEPKKRTAKKKNEGGEK